MISLLKYLTVYPSKDAIKMVNKPPTHQDKYLHRIINKVSIRIDNNLIGKKWVKSMGV